MSEAVRTFTAVRHLTGATWDVRPWDKDEDRSLRRYWGDGLSCAAIAQKLARSKSSIVARANRLALAPRPSPIGPNAAAVRRAFLSAAGLADQAPRKSTPKPGAHHSATEPVDRPQAASPVPPPPASPPKDQVPEHSPPAVSPRLLPPAAFPAFRTCQYPRGDRPHWDFCGEPVAPDRPYCADHVRICWVSPPRKAAA